MFMVTLGKKKANLSLKLNKKKQEKSEEHSDIVVVEENVNEIKGINQKFMWSINKDVTGN